MEKKFHLKRREDHPDKEHSRQPTSLSNVPCLNAGCCCQKIGKAAEMFSLGGALERKAHLVKWDCGLF